MSENACRLLPTELDQFADAYYDRAPVVLQMPLLSDKEEAFKALVVASTGMGSPGARLKVFLGDSQVTDIQHPVLPRPTDTTLDHYLTRLSAESSLHDFAIYVGSVQAVSPLIYDQARQLLIRLFGEQWLPSGWIDLELFFGRYRLTPGGIHQEPRSNLHCVVDGEKSMFVWPEDTWRPESVLTRPELTEAARLTSPNNPLSGAVPILPVEVIDVPGTAGDILYWPPNYWHVGTSPKISIGINIAIYVHDEAFELLTRAVTGQLRAISDGLSLPMPISGPCGEWTSPGMVAQQLSAVHQLAQRDFLGVELTMEWMKRVSGLGFRINAVRNVSADLPMSGLLARSSTARLCWIVVGDSLLLAANGHAEIVAPSPGLVSLLAQVNTGQPFTVSSLLKDVSDSSIADEARSLLGQLYAMRAITEV